MKRLIIIGIIAFVLGYVLGSWFILAGNGLSPISLENLQKENPEERKLTILHALNPLEPMNPGFWFIIKANPD